MNTRSMKRTLHGISILLIALLAPMAANAVPDLNGDCVVNIYDLSIVGSCYGSDPSASPTCAVADVNGDGAIDLTDVNLVAAALGQTGCSTNTAPVADAGPDQTVAVGDTVILDGTGSSDSDGDALTFSWSFLSLPAGSTAALSGPTAVNPTFVADVSGSYVVQLIVNDGTEDSTPDTVTIGTANSAPTADAGADQMAFVGDTVTLDGSGSSDVDGDPLSFNWNLLSLPPGSTASLSDVTSVDPSFVVDLPGTYIVELIVNDGLLDSAPDSVSVSTENSPPVADAGNDQFALVGDTFTLDGSGSSDIDGDPLTFSWSIVSTPAGSNAQLSDAALVDPSFVVDLPGTYVFQLIVNDGTVDSAPDSVSVSTDNSPPVADAGPDQSVLVGDTVTLDGSGSSDVDGDPLTYAWSLSSVPAGSLATLSNPSAVSPDFDADVAGTYVAQLIVNDGSVDSAPDTITITTDNSPPVADAGPDQSVFVSDSVALDGSGSSDVDGDPLSYFWSFTSTPSGSTAVITDADQLLASFNVDLPGSYVVQLIVNDGSVDSAPDTLVVSTLNTLPVADAGPDQSALAGDTVVLDGSGSSDADGDPLSYFWSLSSVPAGSGATLDDPGAVTPSFEADLAGTYVAQLIVNDGTGDSAPDTVTVTVGVGNTPPVAAITGDSAIDLGDTANFSGASSSDPDGDPLTYSWTLTAVPAGNTASLVGANTETPSLTPNVAGVYTVQLVVNDGTDDSTPTTFDVTVTAAVVVNAVDDVFPTPPVLHPSDQPATIQVLANDSPAGVTLGSFTQPANGLVTPNADGTIEYRQGGLAFEEEGLNLLETGECNLCHRYPEFSGTDTFTYTAEKDASSDTAVVTVNVESFKWFGGNGGPLTAATPLDGCSDLPSDHPGAFCRGLSDSEIRAIRDFLDQGFPPP